ncbi:hypothetical protein ACA910_004064 [Epithemia clementina (nom. ined.)]
MIDKSNSDSSMKEGPRRPELSTGGSSSFKYASPSPRIISWSKNMSSSSDGTLQPTTKRRRYMRRGSKCPSMLMLVPIMQNPNTGSSTSSSNETLMSAMAVKPTTPRHHQQRRLSMMSALKMSLERISVVDTPTTTPQGLRTMTPEERRKSTYELLSQI